jgi:hypothetical protein
MRAIGRIAEAAILHGLCPKGMGVRVKKVNYKKYNSLGKNYEVRTAVLTPCSSGLCLRNQSMQVHLAQTKSKGRHVRLANYKKHNSFWAALRQYGDYYGIFKLLVGI